jgi:hypothetical protein
MYSRSQNGPSRLYGPVLELLVARILLESMSLFDTSQRLSEAMIAF